MVQQAENKTWPTGLTPAIFERLTAPLAADEIEVRIGAVTRDGTAGLVIPYVQAQAIRNRLDAIVGPTNWEFIESERLVEDPIVTQVADRDGVIKARREGRKIVVWGKLRVCGVERQDCGEAYKEDEAFKSAMTDCFKRCGTALGIGRELYMLPRNLWAPIEQRGQNNVFVDEAAARVEIVAMIATQTKRPEAQSSQSVAEREAQPQPQRRGASPPAKPANGGPTTQQLNNIARMRKDLFGSDADGETEYRTHLHETYGVASSKQLSTHQCNDLIQWLHKELQGRASRIHPGGEPDEDDQAALGALSEGG